MCLLRTTNRGLPCRNTPSLDRKLLLQVRVDYAGERDLCSDSLEC